MPTKKLTSNIKGQIAQTKAELRALELGYMPSKPVFDARYDLILDKSGILKKVQVKYADGKASNKVSGVVVVHLDYSDRKGKLKTYSAKEIDGIIAYIPKVEQLCFFPPEIFEGKYALHIRLDEPKNKQTRRVILAKDYYW